MKLVKNNNSLSQNFRQKVLVVVIDSTHLILIIRSVLLNLTQKLQIDYGTCCSSVFTHL